MNQKELVQFLASAHNKPVDVVFGERVAQYKIFFDQNGLVLIFEVDDHSAGATFIRDDLTVEFIFADDIVEVNAWSSKGALPSGKIICRLADHVDEAAKVSINNESSTCLPCTIFTTRGRRIESLRRFPLKDEISCALLRSIRLDPSEFRHGKNDLTPFTDAQLHSGQIDGVFIQRVAKIR